MWCQLLDHVPALDTVISVVQDIGIALLQIICVSVVHPVMPIHHAAVTIPVYQVILIIFNSTCMHVLS